MNKFIHLAAMTAIVIGMELAGLSGAAQAMADPEDEDIIADQLCPFRNVIDRMGGDDQCDPDWNNDNIGSGAPNECAPGGGWVGNNELCPPPTVNVNVNHDINGNHQITINGQQVDPKNITVDGKPAG